MSSCRLLTKDTIIEITGENNLDVLRELEILFNTFDEIGGLEECTNLQKLSLLDNGLKRISNLTPVSLTLTTLCICDQDLSRMECLDLPNLRNLYLHRNNIEQISGLSACPRLKRLWLFQNKLTSIEDMHCIPELQELWLQANRITTTRGLEVSAQLKVLGLAGNPIADFNDVKRLGSLESLADLSMSDIHFGRCPVVDEAGYSDYVLMHCPGLTVLDGVYLSAVKKETATSNYKSAVKHFNDSITEIEDRYQQEVQELKAKQRSRESHFHVLEKELSSALDDLQLLVKEQRGKIAGEIERQNEFMEDNSNTLLTAIDRISKKSISDLEHSAVRTARLQDFVESLYCYIERLRSAELNIIDLLCMLSEMKLIQFQAIGDHLPDFHYLSSLLRVPSFYSEKNPISSEYKDGNPSFSSSVEPIGMSSAFKIRLNKRPETIASDNGFTSSRGGGVVEESSSKYIFTVLSLEKLEAVISRGWISICEETAIFSSDAWAAVALLASKESSLDELDRQKRSKAENSDSSYLDDSFEVDGHVGNGAGAKADAAGIPLFTKSEADATSGKLKKAKDANICALIGCNFTLPRQNLSSRGFLKFPVLQSARERLLQDLTAQSTPVIYDIDVGRPEETPSTDTFLNANDHLLYALPLSLCEQLVVVQFVCAVITPLPPLSTAPPLGSKDGLYGSSVMRDLESSLESAMTPLAGMLDSRASDIFVSFEQEISSQLNMYMEQLLEETSPQRAEELRLINSEMIEREKALKAAREEVEYERRTQDATLKDIRHFNAETRENASNGGRGSKHSSSSGTGQVNKKSTAR